MGLRVGAVALVRGHGIRTDASLFVGSRRDRRTAAAPVANGEPLTTEDGELLTTENGETLTTEG